MMACVTGMSFKQRETALVVSATNLPLLLFGGSWIIVLIVLTLLYPNACSDLTCFDATCVLSRTPLLSSQATVVRFPSSDLVGATVGLDEGKHPLLFQRPPPQKPLPFYSYTSPTAASDAALRVNSALALHRGEGGGGGREGGQPPPPSLHPPLPLALHLAEDESYVEEGLLAAALVFLVGALCLCIHTERLVVDFRVGVVVIEHCTAVTSLREFLAASWRVNNGASDSGAGFGAGAGAGGGRLPMTSTQSTTTTQVENGRPGGFVGGGATVSPYSHLRLVVSTAHVQAVQVVKKVVEIKPGQMCDPEYSLMLRLRGGGLVRLLGSFPNPGGEALAEGAKEEIVRALAKAADVAAAGVAEEEERRRRELSRLSLSLTPHTTTTV